MSVNKNENHQAIVLGTIDFVYLFASLILINPDLYRDSQSGTFISAYGTSAIVYAFGVIFPLWSRLILGDVPENRLLRITDMSALVFAILSFCGILIYYIWNVGNWMVWLSYIMAVLTAGPSIFSVILAAREYINK